MSPGISMLGGGTGGVVTESDPVAEADLNAHKALKVGVHGLPASPTSGHGVVWDGTNWVDADLATQAELDAAVAFAPLRPETYGAKGDVVWLSDIATTSASAVITSASASFTNADVGKRVSIQGAATGPVALHTTIASRQSATQVTLTDTAGVSLTGAIGSYATDDTTAVQAAFTAASAAHGTVALSKFYAITSELSITDSCDVAGTGVYGKWGNYSGGHGLGIPWAPPYLVGCGLHVMASGLRSALAITNEACAVNLRSFGICFAAPFFSTGHGIHAVPGATKNGLAQAKWDDIKVFGHDGTSYAFNLSNFFHCTFTHLRGWGGGLIQMEQNHGTWAYGNSAFVGCTGKMFTGNSAHCWSMLATSGAFTQIGLFHPGFNCVLASTYGFSTFNGRTLTGISGSQKLANIPQNSIQGLGILNSSFDLGGTAVSAPTLPTALATTGQFISPDAWGMASMSFKMMISPSSGVTIPGEINGVYENLGTGTITASVRVDLESASGGNITRTLPALSASKGVMITLKKTDVTANTVTLARAGSDTIDGATSVVLSTQYQKVTVVGGTTQWWVMEN